MTSLNEGSMYRSGRAVHNLLMLYFCQISSGLQSIQAAHTITIIDGLTQSLVCHENVLLDKSIRESCLSVNQLVTVCVCAVVACN